MNIRLKTLLYIGAIVALSGLAQARPSLGSSGGGDPWIEQASGGGSGPTAPPPPAPPSINTNGTFGQVISFGLNLLPQWDPTATNSFVSGEIEFSTAPLWKSQTGAGTTPYNSTSLADFFTLNFGAGGELVTFGDGTGNSVVDSGSLLGFLREPVGNIAPYAIFAAGRDFAKGRWQGGIGPGIDYQTKTIFRIFVDTRFTMEGTQNKDTGWMTRIGVTLPWKSVFGN